MYFITVMKAAFHLVCLILGHVVVLADFTGTTTVHGAEPSALLLNSHELLLLLQVEIFAEPLRKLSCLNGTLNWSFVESRCTGHLDTYHIKPPRRCLQERQTHSMWSVARAQLFISNKKSLHFTIRINIVAFL